MGQLKDPFEKILAIESVRAAYVYGPTGELLDKRETGSKGSSFPLKRWGAIATELANKGREISEVILFYPRLSILFRSLGDRALVLVADARAVPSLLRVTVDVVEHEWRARGIERLFPTGEGGGGAAGALGRFFGRRKPSGSPTKGR
jgi:hypothetical protein